MIVLWLFLAVPCVCLQFVIVVFPDHAHLLFFVVLSVLSSFVIVLMGEREGAGSLPICILSSWCQVAAIVL